MQDNNNHTTEGTSMHNHYRFALLRPSVYVAAFFTHGRQRL